MSNIAGAYIENTEPLTGSPGNGNISSASLEGSQPELLRITLNITGAATINVTTIAAVLKAEGLPDLPLIFDQNLIADINQKYADIEDLLIDATIEGDADGESFTIELTDETPILI